jgi:acyl carrier protein
MSAETIAQRLCELLAYYSGASAAALGPTSTPQNTPGWDSAANLNFIAAVEEEFAVTIATRDALRLRTLGAFVEYIAAREISGVCA